MLEIPVKNVKIASPDGSEDASSMEASNDGDSESADNMEIAPVSIDESDNNNNNTFDYTQLPFLNHDDIPKDIDILDNVSK